MEKKKATVASLPCLGVGWGGSLRIANYHVRISSMFRNLFCITS